MRASVKCLVVMVAAALIASPALADTIVSYTEPVDWGSLTISHFQTAAMGWTIPAGITYTNVAISFLAYGDGPGLAWPT